MYRHSGPLSKGQRELGTQCRDTQDFYLKLRGEVGDSVQTLRTSIKSSEGSWETVYRHSGPVSKGQRGGGRQCTDTQDLYLKVRGELGDSVQTLRTSI